MILTAQYWPREYNPLRQGALVDVLSFELINDTSIQYIVKGFDGSTWKVYSDELEVRAQSKEEDDD